MANAFDSTNYPRGVPATLPRGTRWAWREDGILADYPAASYSWAWIARPESGVTAGRGEISVSGSASGAAVLFEVATATTQAYPLGRYRWEYRITRTSDSEVVTLHRGIVVIEPDADDTTADQRSTARIALEHVERWLAGERSPQVSYYAIGGLAVSQHPINDLLAWRNRLRHEVAAEDRAALRAAGRASGMRVRARFNA